jgi:SAM-dependent methyltransferase
MLSMAVGFLSLSQEIVWVRIVSFALKGVGQSFALVLFFFLAGIAFGSAAGKRLCERQSDLLRSSALVLGAAALLDATLVLLLPVLAAWRWAGLAVMLLLVGVTAALKSVLFPIAHHLGSQQTGARIGRSVSKVYFGNIVGSTLGPIITGYVLLNYLSAAQCMTLIGAGAAVLSLACSLKARARTLAAAVPAALAPVAFLAWLGAPHMVPEIALHTDGSTPGRTVNHVIENRHGIVHTVAEPDATPDTVFGGNVYDGRTDIDVAANYGGLDRALVLLAVHPNPERVLVVGMSTGAWARILSASPRIKRMTIVEINPAYLKLISQYPQVVGILDDPRIEIVIDDGRRWLRRNPGETFDLVVQNNTFTWRAYSTNLLSREYLQLMAAHLRPGGIAAFNTTYSGDVLRTARCVFPFVERRSNFVYASRNDFSHPAPHAEEALRELRAAGIPVFDTKTFSPGGLARAIIDTPFMPRDMQFSGLSPFPQVITDQNLLVEYAHGKILRDVLPAAMRMVDAARSALGGSADCGG